MVASKSYGSITMKPQFDLRFTMEEGASDFNLILQNVTKGDEAYYFCSQSSLYSWDNCTFLSVKDHNDNRFVSQTVVQQPVSASAQLGDPVALQCSITSQRTDHSNQCQGEPSVYWFRSGSGPSHPAAIYMNWNSSGECQNSSGPPSAPQSCVYTLPKNNVDSSDAGTYYCALAACGEAVFGSGTTLDITQPNHHLVILVHRMMSSCCLLVIVILILIIHYRFDRKTDSLNYAALEFNGRKKTNGGKKNSERTQENRLLALVNVIVLISPYESFHCLIQVCPREVKMADHIIDQRIRTYFNQVTSAERLPPLTYDADHRHRDGTAESSPLLATAIDSSPLRAADVDSSLLIAADENASLAAAFEKVSRTVAES
ncbi:uncharacterized protein LOC115552043 [Gadus morhua]|uniref:uncharacterized protein LOC115552043 n=1 Tax=Gadus morhua TaxID=8049 RepID=UPI0011B74D42|nr:uncharacterized protein LOC115552043 [Gadus morhua]